MSCQDKEAGGGPWAVLGADWLRVVKRSRQWRAGGLTPPKINFNQRGDAILSNVKTTAALGPLLQQKNYS